jgi:hypothetical protein
VSVVLVSCPSVEIPDLAAQIDTSTAVGYIRFVVRSFLDHRSTWADSVAVIESVMPDDAESQGVKLAALCFLRTFKAK